MAGSRFPATHFYTDIQVPAADESIAAQALRFIEANFDSAGVQHARHIFDAHEDLLAKLPA